ncbi:MAG: polymerase subunit sigma-24 [Actinomycetia bacterium]|nr:polymerase subunit sigma-24 [Actinomycetes bacterium]
MINSPDGATADSADGTAFGVFSDYGELLFSMVYNLLGSVADTEDVLQDTWLAWRGRIAARTHQRATGGDGGRDRSHPVLRLRGVHPRSGERLRTNVLPKELLLPPNGRRHPGVGPGQLTDNPGRQGRDAHR